MNAAVLEQPLNELQLDLLELFARQVSEEDLKQLRQLFSTYFAEKAMKEMEKALNDKGFNQSTENTWLNEHMRTPYHR